jgi:hypothetical protein
LNHNFTHTNFRGNITNTRYAGIQALHAELLEGAGVADGVPLEVEVLEGVMLDGWALLDVLVLVSIAVLETVLFMGVALLVVALFVDVATLVVFGCVYITSRRFSMAHGHALPIMQAVIIVVGSHEPRYEIGPAGSVARTPSKTQVAVDSRLTSNIWYGIGAKPLNETMS